MIDINDKLTKACERMISEQLSMDSVLVSYCGSVYEYYFSGKPVAANIRSISKPITCLCFGIAIDRGLFQGGLNEKIWKYLKQTQVITNESNIQYISDWTLKTLLTLTIGYEEKMLDSKHLPSIEGLNYADVVLNHELKHAPGEYFLYSNAAMYLASVVFQNAIGLSLLDFANEYLFSPLEIYDVKWKMSPQGYNMGCTGIEMMPMDLLKIGQLLLGKGCYKNKNIVSSSWIEDMMSPQVLTPQMYDEKRVLPKYSYGLNMWICKDGIAYCDGTDGQYLIVIPQKEMVIITSGNQSDMKPITRCLEELIRS